MKTIASKINHRMPLNYRKLRIIALLMMTFSQVSAMLLLMQDAYRILGEPVPIDKCTFLLKVLQGLGVLTMPLLMVAVMSEILRKPKSIVKILIQNFIGAVLLVLLNIFIIRAMMVLMMGMVQLASTGEFVQHLPEVVRFIQLPGFPELMQRLIGDAGASIADQMVRVVNAIPKEMIDGVANAPQVRVIFSKIFTQDALMQIFDRVNDLALQFFLESHTKNIFIDVLLCSLTYFFAFYMPRRLRGGKVMLFRLGMAIPLVYIIVGYMTNVLVRNDLIPPTEMMLSLLPSNNPLMYITFIAIIVFRKYQELEFFAHGGAKQDLDSYLNSDRGTWQMSSCLAIVFIVYSLFDYLMTLIPGMRAGGFGAGAWAFLGAPILWLFSMKREAKHRWIDVVYTPVYYGINLVVLVFLLAYIADALETILKRILMI